MVLKLIPRETKSASWLKKQTYMCHPKNSTRSLSVLSLYFEGSETICVDLTDCLSSRAVST